MAIKICCDECHTDIDNYKEVVCYSCYRNLLDELEIKVEKIIRLKNEIKKLEEDL